MQDGALRLGDMLDEDAAQALGVLGRGAHRHAALAVGRAGPGVAGLAPSPPSAQVLGGALGLRRAERRARRAHAAPARRSSARASRSGRTRRPSRGRQAARAGRHRRRAGGGVRRRLGRRGAAAISASMAAAPSSRRRRGLIERRQCRTSIIDRGATGRPQRRQRRAPTMVGRAAHRARARHAPPAEPRDGSSAASGRVQRAGTPRLHRLGSAVQHGTVSSQARQASVMLWP